MRKASGLVAAVVVSVLTASAATAASDDGSANLRVNDIVVGAAPEVAVTVTAPQTPSSADLPAGAFTVLEAGLPVEHSVKRLPTERLQIVLLLDTSGSMVGQPLVNAKASATNFIEQFPSGVQFSVVAFSSAPTVATPLSDDIDAHINAIQNLEAAGETALYDGLIAAARQFEGRTSGRQVIVLLSDGGDTVSTSTLGKTRRRLSRGHASVYGIRYTTAETNSAALDGVAVRGRVLGAKGGAALAKVYDTIASELTSQYRLTWTTESSGTTPVKLSVKAGSTTATATITLDLPRAARAAAPATDPEPAPAVPAPAAEPVPAPTFLAARIALIVGGVLFFIGVSLLLLLIAAPRRRAVRIMGGPREHADPIHRSLSELTEHAVQVAERGLQRRNLASKLNSALERAGINLRPAEFLVLIMSATLTAFAAGAVSSGAPLGFALAIAVIIFARIFVTFRADRRRSRFADQLNDTLQLLAGSLRAGYGMMQAIDSVAQETREPTAQEFRRLVVESRLGRDLTVSLQAMAERIRNGDFEWVVQAILIHREVGGDLAEVLETVAGTIRERNQVRRQVKALAAEGKLSGIILTLVPPAVGLLINVINPGYLNPLFTTLPGIFMSIAGLTLLVIGGLWMRKTVRIVF